nr:GNAT family N-acetyltransferase [Paenibacillus xylanexedens]
MSNRNYTKPVHPQSIQIELVTPERYKEAAELMAYGFGHKFQHSSSLSISDLSSTFEQLLIHEPRQTHSLRVVTLENNTVTGTLGLKWKAAEGVDSVKRTNLKWWKACSHIGYWKLMRILAGIQLLKHEPSAGECYIEDLVVHPTYQGKGLAKRLLDWAQHYMLHSSASLSYLSLHVARNNEHAIQLYERVHFHKKNCTRSLLTGMLLGEQYWYYMTRKGDYSIETEQA